MACEIRKGKREGRTDRERKRERKTFSLYELREGISKRETWSNEGMKII